MKAPGSSARAVDHTDRPVYRATSDRQEAMAPELQRLDALIQRCQKHLERSQ
jgi:hypothetical protein